MELTHAFNRLQLSALFHRINRNARRLSFHICCCELCNQPCQQFNLLCTTCFEDLPKFQYQTIAADLLNWPAIYQHVNHSHIDHLVSFMPYIWPMELWLNQLKYQGRFELAQLLAQLIGQLLMQPMMQHYLTAEPVLIPVPNHIKRWQQRGYNQAHLISKALARQLQLQCQPKLLVKHQETSSQVGQSGRQRRQSLANAFHVNCKVAAPTHVILVDDVCTTGSTVNQLAKLLKRSGVKTVTVVTAALSLPKLN
jgi:ComF family protein